MNAKKLKKIPQLAPDELALEKEIEAGDYYSFDNNEEALEFLARELK